MSLQSEATVERGFEYLFAITSESDGVQHLIPSIPSELSVLAFHAVDAARDEPVVAAVVEPEPALPDPVQQIRTMIDVAREEAATEARQQLEAQLKDETEARVLLERQRITDLCESFAHDRQQYFATVEDQVVRLALAIAARVLHREAKANPVLLADTVKAALARVEESSGTTLRVPPDELSLWSNVFPQGAEPLVHLSADARMKPGDCVLETNIGRVDLGIDVQLEEIDRGFSEPSSVASHGLSEVQD
ncbi:hypothetical protein FTO74_11470 [Granulicella sp. WH15]|uniref:FliH/SctL family protein n=1 Tax=Granulicella sp. WH15 TaxID=2602070 RepID=UPI001366968E|nr:FliH/SctL family protein [Granulicella sp. WH15]QHN03919.1 hypothetical protein FTO74_11470 [Granulicella sp. WH15]